MVERDGVEVLLEDVIFPTVTEEGLVFGEYDFIPYGYRDKPLGRLLSHTFWRSAMAVEMVWDSIIDLFSGRYSMEQVSGPIGSLRSRSARRPRPDPLA